MKVKVILGVGVLLSAGAFVALSIVTMPWEWPIHAAVIEDLVANERTGMIDRWTRLPDDETSVPGGYRGCFQRSALPQVLAEHFLRRNERSRWISNRRTLIKAARYAGNAVCAYLQDDGSYEPIRPRIVLSTVARARDGRTALVYVDHFCPLCGYGGYVYLERRHRAWKVVDRCDRWVS